MNSKMTVPEIRRAIEADVPAIARLADVIWRLHYPGIISTRQIDHMLAKMYSREQLLHEIRVGAIRYELLFVGKELAGFAAHGPTEQPDLFKLHKVYLHPAYHGQGLGTSLLRHCEREAQQLGVKRLMLAVNKGNAKAIAAYRRNGFTIRESVVLDIGQGFVMDDYLMEKDLVT
jgi:ribosomal protein S18 acetylase RimI-like enzyme